MSGPRTFYGVPVIESPHIPPGAVLFLQRSPRILECGARELYEVAGALSTVPPCPKCARRELIRSSEERLTAAVLRNVGRACPVGWLRTSG